MFKEISKSFRNPSPASRLMHIITRKWLPVNDILTTGTQGNKCGSSIYRQPAGLGLKTSKMERKRLLMFVWMATMNKFLMKPYVCHLRNYHSIMNFAVGGINDHLRKTDVHSANAVRGGMLISRKFLNVTWPSCYMKNKWCLFNQNTLLERAVQVLLDITISLKNTPADVSLIYNKSPNISSFQNEWFYVEKTM